jgi:hypothetical protein
VSHHPISELSLKTIAKRDCNTLKAHSTSFRTASCVVAKYILFPLSVIGWSLQMLLKLDICHLQDSSPLCSHVNLHSSLLFEVLLQLTSQIAGVGVVH